MESVFATPVMLKQGDFLFLRILLNDIQENLIKFLKRVAPMTWVILRSIVRDWSRCHGLSILQVLSDGFVLGIGHLLEAVFSEKNDGEAEFLGRKVHSSPH